MIDPTYTPAVKRLAEQIRKLTTGELLALREALATDFDILPPDIGVREPRRPEGPSPLTGAAEAEQQLADLREAARAVLRHPVMNPNLEAWDHLRELADEEEN